MNKGSDTSFHALPIRLKLIVIVAFVMIWGIRSIVILLYRFWRMSIDLYVHGYVDPIFALTVVSLLILLKVLETVNFFVRHLKTFKLWVDISCHC